MLPTAIEAEFERMQRNESRFLADLARQHQFRGDPIFCRPNHQQPAWCIEMAKWPYQAARGRLGLPTLHTGKNPTLLTAPASPP
jgi:hypothetical protein